MIKRSPKRFMEELENIEFTTKPDIMSTLAMLKEEGRVEGEIAGRKEGAIKGKTIQALKSLLNVLLLFPDISVEKIKLLTGLEVNLIKAFQEKLKTKKIRTIKAFIKKQILGSIELDKKEQKEIHALIQQLLKK